MKKLSKYLEKRAAAIDSVLMQSPDDFTIETFHSLRVEIKKINSLFELVNKLSKDFKKHKTFELFDSFFQRAGKIRELQIEDLFLIKYSDNTTIKNYRHALQEKELDEKREFFILQKKIDKLLFEKTYAEVDSFLKKLDSQQVFDYLNKKRKKLQQNFLELPLRTKRMHKIRKELKQILSVEKMVDCNRGKKKSDQQIILSELLGQWHDGVVIAKHLKNVSRSSEAGEEDVLMFKKISSSISSQINILANKINKKAAHFQE